MSLQAGLAFALAFIGAAPLAAQPPEGRALFGQYCSIPYCHGTDGGEGRAPTLRGGVWSRESLAGTIGNGVPDSSMPPFGDRLSSDELEAIVGFILSMGREAATESSSAAVEGDPPYDLTAGRALFYEGRCAACHRFGRDGLPGPDLRDVADRRPIAILRDILEPGRNVEGAKPFVRMHLDDGTSFEAIIQEEAESFVRANDLSVEPYVLRRFSRAEIERIEPIAGTAMPSHLTDGMSVEQMLDLVFFIRAGGVTDRTPEVTYRDVASPSGGGKLGTFLIPVTGEDETLPALAISGLADAYATYIAAEGFAVLNVGDRDPASEEALAYLRGEARVDANRLATWASAEPSPEAIESAVARFREQLEP